MDRQWQKSITHLLIALVFEILLNCLGLDQLADYGEFVFNLEAFKPNRTSLNFTTI